MQSKIVTERSNSTNQFQFATNPIASQMQPLLFVLGRQAHKIWIVSTSDGASAARWQEQHGQNSSDGATNQLARTLHDLTNQLQSNKRAYKLPFDKMLLAAPIQEDGAVAKFRWQHHAIKPAKVSEKQCHQKWQKSVIVHQIMHSRSPSCHHLPQW